MKKILLTIVLAIFITIPMKAYAQTTATAGGTGLKTYTAGDIIYAATTNPIRFTKLLIGAEGTCLKVSSSVPAWLTCAAGGSGGGTMSTSTAWGTINYNYPTVATDILTVGYDGTGVATSTNEAEFYIDPVAKLSAFLNGTKLGIGTTSPYATLSVVGSGGVVAESFNATTSKNSSYNAFTAQNTNAGTSATAGFSFFNNAGGTGSFGSFSTTYTGIPVLAGRLALLSDTAVSSATGLDFIASKATDDLRFYAGGLTSASEKMRITSTGVGIGTTTPGTVLGVVGDGYFTGRVTANHFVSTSTTDYNRFPLISIPNESGLGAIYGDDVSGTKRAIFGVGNTAMASNSTRFRSAGGGLSFENLAAQTIFSILDAGNVGVGTTTPGTILSVAGVANFASTGSTLYSTLTAPYFIATSTRASIFPYASTTAFTVSGALYNSSLSNGCLNVASGLIGSTGSACGSGSGGGGLGWASTTVPNSDSIFSTALSNVGIGTTSPFGKLSIQNLSTDSPSSFILNIASTTSTGTTTSIFNINNNADIGTLGNYFTTSGQNGTTSISSLLVGTQNFDDDAGAVQWINLPVVNATAGTTQGYTAFLDDNPALTIYGVSSGSGAVGAFNVGVGTSSPYSKFSVWGAGTGTGKTFTVINSASSTKFEILDNGNTAIGTTSALTTLTVNGTITSTSTPPAISSCGTSPTVVGNNNWGTITTGATATACTATFATAYPTFASCVISNQSMSVVNAMTYTVSKTAFTVTQTGLGGAIINYKCDGY